MLKDRRMILVGALGVMLGAVPTGPLHAQPTPDATPGWTETRPAFETHYTRLRIDGDGRSYDVDGVGARLMWRPAPRDGALAALANRSEFGVFATYTPRSDFQPGIDFASLGLGVAMDVRPLEYPLAGRVEPFLSLGTGVLHTDVDRTVNDAPSPLLTRSQTMFTLVPGVGARVMLTPTIALQGDVRDLMTFRGDTRHNVAFGAGLRMTF